MTERMWSTCRICQDDYEDLIPIFTEEDKKFLTNLGNKIKWAFEIDIDKEGLESMICDRCLEEYYLKKDLANLQIDASYFTSFSETRPPDQSTIEQVENLNLNKRDFQCQDCPENFNDEQLLIQHAKEKHNMFEVYFGQPYSGLKYLVSYEQVNNGNNPGPSTSQDRSADQSLGDSHSRRVNRSLGKIWKCSRCAFLGYTSSELFEHEKVHDIIVRKNCYDQ